MPLQTVGWMSKGGLMLHLPSEQAPEGSLLDGKNIFIDWGFVKRASGYSKLTTTLLNGPVWLIEQAFRADETTELVACTSASFYKFA